MKENAIDRLIEKIKQTNNPTVIGIDTGYEKIPDCIKEKYSQDISGTCKSILEFNKGLIDATYDIIPAVKINIAFYEMYGIEGMKTFEETCKYAKEKQMIVIADIKRGDWNNSPMLFKCILRKNKNRRKRRKHIRYRLCNIKSIYGNRQYKTIYRRLQKIQQRSIHTSKNIKPIIRRITRLKTRNRRRNIHKSSKTCGKLGRKLKREIRI